MRILAAAAAAAVVAGLLIVRALHNLEIDLTNLTVDLDAEDVL